MAMISSFKFRRSLQVWGWLVFAGLLFVAGIFFWNQSLRPRVAKSVPSERTRNELVLREGRLLDGGLPFTGVVTDHYSGGELKSHSVVSNGLLEGVSEGWYTNGQKQVTEHFVAGVSHGLRTKWYPNGVKQSEVTIINGELHGTFQRWHENGQLSEQVEMSHGQPAGLSLAYHPSGALKARVKLEGGKILEQQSWPDGGSQ